MSSKNCRGKLLVDMCTGKITIENADEVTSDPFISGAYDPVRNYNTTHIQPTETLITEARISNHQTQEIFDSSQFDIERTEYPNTSLNVPINDDGKKNNNVIMSDENMYSARPNSVLSDVTVCLEENEKIGPQSQSILPNDDHLSVFEVYQMYGEESNRGQFCEVDGCTEEVFSACHRCQILQCWEHFTHDTSCEDHQHIIPNATSQTSVAQPKSPTEEYLKEPEKNQNELFKADPINTEYYNKDRVMSKQIQNSNGIAFTDSNYILDDQTGWLIEHQQTEVSRQNSTTTNLILDDQTGELIEPEQQKRTTDINIENISTDSSTKNRAFNKAQRVKGMAHMKRKIDKENNGVTFVPKPRKIMKVKPCTHELTHLKTSRTYLCALLSDDQRECIFNYFWDLDTWDAKKAYLKNLVRIRPIVKRRKESVINIKTIGYDCYLPSECNELVKVCKKFLLSTLDINNETLTEWIKSLNDHNKSKPNKKSATSEKSASVKEWLDLLPKVPSHYCRSSSNRRYVESSFMSKAHMYRTYKQWCIEKNKPMAQRKLFCENLKMEKISIHKPRKDQCDMCTAFKEHNITIEEHETHQKMKEEAYAAKRETISLCSPEVLVFSADTQSVLLCPKLLVSEQYYKQKLQIHNYTIYCNNNKEVHLYVWHEGHGDVTSNEFTTCLLDYLESQVGLGFKKVVMFSDGCGYQNRNKVLASALNDFAKLKGIEIEQRFLEKGHTMMEADSVHSTLEKLFNPPIFLPSDYVNLMAQARPSQPYIIHHLDYSFFKNFSNVCKIDSLRPGKKTGDPVVTNIRALLYKNGNIFYKLRHSEDWKELPHNLQSNKKKISALYKTERKIEKSKYLSLQSLKKYMHRDNHKFYDDLKHLK